MIRNKLDFEIATAKMEGLAMTSSRGAKRRGDLWTIMFKFGTDGYRAIIGDGFDFPTVGTLTKGLALSLKQKKEVPHVLIGYDTRFLSDKFAAYATQVALEEGLKVELTNNFVPTPMLSYAVIDKAADAGIMITASHNSYYYNGFKIKNNEGGSATAEQIASIQPFLSQEFKLPALRFHDKPKYLTFNPKNKYFEHLEKVVTKDKFQGAKLKVIVDPIYGAGRGYFKELLQNYGLSTQEIHSENNPTFGGLNPEPIDPHIGDLRAKVLETQADIGLALDGDADRSGVIDEKGNFINSHQIFALLLYHLAENKKKRGLIVKTYSTTSLVDIMAKHYGLGVIQTPIGFKYISDLMLKKDVLIGGEESGGIGIKGHIPERDGMLIGLMLVELMLESGKPISTLVGQLYKKFGTFAYDRIDKTINKAAKQTLYEALEAKDISKLVNKNLCRFLNKDGCKYEFEDKSWLMFRLSGTESIVRIYAEAPHPDEVNRLLTIGDNLITNLTSA